MSRHWMSHTSSDIQINVFYPSGHVELRDFYLRDEINWCERLKRSRVGLWVLFGSVSTSGSAALHPLWGFSAHLYLKEGFTNTSFPPFWGFSFSYWFCFVLLWIFLIRVDFFFCKTLHYPEFLCPGGLCCLQVPSERISCRVSSFCLRPKQNLNNLRQKSDVLRL